MQGVIAVSKARMLALCGRWRLRRWPQPQRCLGGLHRLVHHRQQLAPERVQVELVAQVGAERLDRLGGVMAAVVLGPAAPRRSLGH
jgi:hypothetical protein